MDIHKMRKRLIEEDLSSWDRRDRKNAKKDLLELQADKIKKLRHSSKFRLYSIYCDGSASHNGQTNAAAGWGYVVIVKRDQQGFFPHKHGIEYKRDCGPVITMGLDDDFIGATVHSNNTAELSALYHSLLTAKKIINGACKYTGHIAIFTDSQYVINMTYRIYSPDDNNPEMKNRALVLKCRRLYDEIADKVSLHWVKGHDDCEHNILADKLANDGRELL